MRRVLSRRRSRLSTQVSSQSATVSARPRMARLRDPEPVPRGRGGLTGQVAAAAQRPPSPVHVPGQGEAKVPAPVPGLTQPQARRTPSPSALVPAPTTREHRTHAPPAQVTPPLPQRHHPTGHDQVPGDQGNGAVSDLKPHRYRNAADRHQRSIAAPNPTGPQPPHRKHQYPSKERERDRSPTRLTRSNSPSETARHRDSAPACTATPNPTVPPHELESWLSGHFPHR